MAEFAVRCGYLQPDQARELYQTYDEIIRMIVSMVKYPNLWTLNE